MISSSRGVRAGPEFFLLGNWSPKYLGLCAGERCLSTKYLGGGWARRSAPDVFERFGQGLLLYGTVGMSGVAGEDELIVIALGGQHFGHVLVGEDPVVIIV